MRMKTVPALQALLRVTPPIDLRTAIDILRTAEMCYRGGEMTRDSIYAVAHRLYPDYPRLSRHAKTKVYREVRGLLRLAEVANEVAYGPAAAVAMMPRTTVYSRCELSVRMRQNSLAERGAG